MPTGQIPFQGFYLSERQRAARWKHLLQRFPDPGCGLARRCRFVSSWQESTSIPLQKSQLCGCCGTTQPKPASKRLDGAAELTPAHDSRLRALAGSRRKTSPVESQFPSSSKRFTLLIKSFIMNLAREKGG